ncbi:hypothetical protein TSUD_387190 [Trifolium subterraneum]|uniref:Uncharacterized protein n=1 Tax=Trifolium subterraneum TaxID=3900 RepID=A0A2Z6PCD0_TRISU|nr:hypothetical protein TSUD_387190 [Trifolium subterraneum]
MTPPKLTDYERNRLENICRNNEKMAALNIQSKASELHAKVKRTVKLKPKTKTPVVTRSSLRTRGIDDSDHSFIESLVGTSNKEFSVELNRTAKKKKKIESSLHLESLSFNPKNIVRVAPARSSRITRVKFLPSNNVKMIVAGCAVGEIGIWNVGQSKDSRIRKCSSPSHFSLHRMRINTIDFDPKNPHIAVTSSADGTACTWDFRCTGDKGNLTAIKTFTYERALQSAYFSPSGCSIAITSLNNMIGIHNGVNFEDAAVVILKSIRKGSDYRAIWGWDDSYLFTGSGTNGVSVVSTARKATIMTLESPLITAFPQRFDAHPYEVGMLAGGTAGGEVYIWTSSQDF